MVWQDEELIAPRLRWAVEDHEKKREQHKQGGKMECEDATGSVFDHLGFTPQEAAELKLKGALARYIRHALESHDLAQKEAAMRTGMRQPEIHPDCELQFHARSPSLGS